MNNNTNIYPDESLSSLLYRFSIAEKYDSIAILAAELGVTPSRINNNECSTSAIEKAAEITGLPAGILYLLTGNHFEDQWGKVIYNRNIFKNRVKFCPDCLKINYYHRKIWSVYPVSVCVEHNNLLIDSCPQCNCPISMDSLMFGFCNTCYFHFEKTAAIKCSDNFYISESQRDLQLKIYGLKSNKDEYFSNISCVEHFILSRYSFHLIEGLDSFIHENRIIIQPFFNQKGGSKTNEHAVTSFGNIYWMYDNFPVNFHKVLDSFNRKRFKEKYIQKAEFENVFAHHSNFLWLRRAYEEYWITQVNEGLVRKDFSVFKSNQSLLEKRSYLRREEVKNQFGVTYENIRHLSDNNLIDIDIKEAGMTKRYCIDKEQIYRAISVNNSYITRSETASLLGIQRDSVPNLIDAGILTLRKSPTNKFLIHADEVRSLLDQCRGKRVSRKTANLVAFHEALIKYSVVGLTIVKLIELMREKTIISRLVKSEGNLSDFYFEKNELRRCIEMIKAENQSVEGYYMKDVIKILKIGEKTMHEIIKKGILVPEKTVIWKDSRKRFMFNKNEIDHFKANHLTIDEASKIFGIPQAKIRKWLKQGVLTDQLEGSSKKYLVSKSQIEGLVN